MKKIYGIVAMLLMLCCSAAFAASSGTGLNEAQIRHNLIQQLEQDGFLSHKLSQEAQLKYVDAAQLKAKVSVDAAKPVQEESLLSRYLTLANGIKVVGLLGLLVAFGGTIRNLIQGVWFLLVLVPVEVYQLPMLGLSLFGTLKPAELWASQAFYVALFCSFANIILVGWVLLTHDKLAKWLANLFKLGIPVFSVISFWGMLYFGALAWLYHSQIFGFFAAVCLSGIFTFGLYYGWGVLVLHFDRDAQAAVVFGHLVVLAAYVFCKINYPALQGLSYFSVGLEYYCTIAMCVGLLVGSAPWSRSKTTGLYVLMFLVVFAATFAGYFLLNLLVIGSIVACFAVLFALEWLAYLSFQGGVIIGCAISGAGLYGLAMMLEKYSHYLVLTTY